MEREYFDWLTKQSRREVRADLGRQIDSNDFRFEITVLCNVIAAVNAENKQGEFDDRRARAKQQERMIARLDRLLALTFIVLGDTESGERIADILIDAKSALRAGMLPQAVVELVDADFVMDQEHGKGNENPFSFASLRFLVQFFQKRVGLISGSVGERLFELEGISSLLDGVAASRLVTTGNVLSRRVIDEFRRAVLISVDQQMLTASVLAALEDLAHELHRAIQ